MYKNSKHLQPRNTGGQFTHATLATFGLSSRICPFCGAINPYEPYRYDRSSGFVEKIKQDPPVICDHCGHTLDSSPASEFNWLILIG